MSLSKEIKDRMSYARGQRNLSAAQVAKLIPMSPQGYLDIESGKSKRPRNLKRIAEILGVSEEWLQFGTGKSPFEPELNRIKCEAIPLLSWSEAANYPANEADIIKNTTIFVPLVGRGSMKSYALKVEGDSMVSPHGRSFYPGEVIIVDPLKTPSNGDFVIAFKEGSETAMFKQYIVDAGIIFLRALNPQYPNVQMESVRVCGVVIARMDYLSA